MAQLHKGLGVEESPRGAGAQDRRKKETLYSGLLGKKKGVVGPILVVFCVLLERVFGPVVWIFVGVFNVVGLFDEQVLHFVGFEGIWGCLMLFGFRVAEGAKQKQHRSPGQVAWTSIVG